MRSILCFTCIIIYYIKVEFKIKFCCQKVKKVFIKEFQFMQILSNLYTTEHTNSYKSFQLLNDYQ